MKYLKLENWPLFGKISSISMVVLLLLVASISIFALPVIEENIMAERKAALENVIHVAYSLMEKFDRQAHKGTISRQQAMASAMEAIKAIRYGKDNTEYLFLFKAEDCKGVMHPIKPELDGQSLAGKQDVNGKYLFSEMADVCRAKGRGFVAYHWPKPGAASAVPKLSYVREYKPWGWIAGSGVYMDDVNACISAIKVKVYLILAFVSVVSLLLAFYIAHRIACRLRMSVEFAQKVSGGDLTGTLNINQEDEVGVLARALNDMVVHLNKMFSELSSNAEDLSASSTELAAISEQLNASAGQTSVKVGNMASAIEEINATVTAISASADQSLEGVSTVARAAREMTGSIGEISRNTEQANQTTQKAVENVSVTLETMNRLGVAANEINKVTDAIYEISEQTNLLALNATIEAARAGEAGKGFSVVAGEIKDLARQTTDATGEIGRRLKGIQSSTKEAVDRINEISSIIYDLNQVVSLVTGSLQEQSANTDEIVTSVTRVNQGIEEISQNLAQVVESSDHVTNDVADVNVNSEETANSGVEVNRSAESLSEMSAMLSQSVSRFRFA